MIKKTALVTTKLIVATALLCALGYLWGFQKAGQTIEPSPDVSTKDGRDAVVKRIVVGTVNSMGFACKTCEWFKHINEGFDPAFGKYQVFLATCDAKPYTIEVKADQSPDNRHVVARGKPGWVKEPDVFDYEFSSQ